MANRNDHLVIMAGGVGSRFWPLSTQQCPKQFVDVLGCGRTLIQMAYDRFRGVFDPENIWVVTNRAYADYIAEQLPDVLTQNVLLEPCSRNTAPCILYASWKIKSINPKANIVVTPSDHLVLNVPEFQRVVNSTLQFAEESDSIITLGMKPNRPETGYGYIQADLSYSTARNREIYRVDSFVEKPTREEAEHFITQKSYFWNSGIFIWSVDTIVNAFRIYDPALSRIFEDLLPYYGTGKEQELIDKHFPECEDISIDYALMEKIEEIYVFPADFGWSDLGTWTSLQNNYVPDGYGNICIGKNITILESTNCVVHTNQEKSVVVQGLDGFVIAENEKQLLVCKLSEEQRVNKPAIKE